MNNKRTKKQLSILILITFLLLDVLNVNVTIGSMKIGFNNFSYANQSNDIQIGAGGYHSFAVDRDGTVRVWGYNHFGQLGIGNMTDQTNPVAIPDLIGVKQISAGG